MKRESKQQKNEVVKPAYLGHHTHGRKLIKVSYYEHHIPRKRNGAQLRVLAAVVLVVIFVTWLVVMGVGR